MTGSSGGRTAGSSAGTAAGTAPGVAVGGLVALTEGVELPGNGKHEVARQVVVAEIVDVVSGNRAAYVGALLQKVVGLERKGEGSVAQELIGYRGVPHPFVLVVARGIATGGGVGEIAVEDHAYGGVVVGREGSSEVMHRHVAGGLERVGGPLDGVARAELEFQIVGAEGDGRHEVEVKRSGAVAGAVVEAHALVIHAEHVGRHLPCLVAQGLRPHAHHSS